MNQSNSRNFNVIQVGALVLAIAGIVLGLVGATDDSDHFYQVYLFGYLFWLQLALGCLGLLLLANLFDARWSFTIKRLMGAGARTLPLLGLLAIPLLISQSEVFPWAASGVELKDGKEVYLNEGFFALRSVFYFLIWTVMAFGLTEMDYQNDGQHDEHRSRRVKQFSVLGMVLFFLTATFAAFDWSLSLSYESFSSIYGWLAMSQMALAAFAFVILMVALLMDDQSLAQIANQRAMSDLGSLLLVSLLVWGYMSFMQFVIMWSGNIPDKVNWYVTRTAGGWEGYAIFMVLLHIIAFILLLVPGLKRERWVLTSIAGLLLLLRVVEMFWVVMPPFMEDLEVVAWDISLIIGFGGVWVALFLFFVERAPLVPANDPGFQKLSKTSAH